MNSRDYWEQRKARELYEQLEDAEAAAEEMRQLYIRASNEIQEKARKIVRRFQLKHGLSAAEADKLLRNITTPEDIDELIRLLRLDPKNADLIAELEAPAYASRLSRLAELQAAVDQVAAGLFRKVRPKMETVLEKIGLGAYYRQIFGMQKRSGAAFPFIPVDEQRLRQVLNTRWSGRNFSEALWGNTEELAAAVKEQILLGILTGKTQKQMAEAIDGRFSKGSNATRRLVRTEANYVANQMSLESYKAHGVDKYIYVAILDLRTSLICRELDKQVFEVKDAQAGFNYPPMHPWCRSTTIAWMPPALLKKLKQAAIDPETGKTVQVPGDMSYNEWYDKYVKGNPVAEAKEKATKNLSADRKQHASYREILGDRVPESVYDFQETKYNNPELWHGWQLDARRQKRLLNDPALNLPGAENAVLPDAKFEQYLFNKGNKYGWAKGQAFSDRLGYDQTNWRQMQKEIAGQAVVTPASRTALTEYGQKYNQEMILYGLKEKPMSVKVAWIIDAETGTTRMITATPGKVKI